MESSIFFHKNKIFLPGTDQIRKRWAFFLQKKRKKRKINFHKYQGKKNKKHKNCIYIFDQNKEAKSMNYLFLEGKNTYVSCVLHCTFFYTVKSWCVKVEKTDYFSFRYQSIQLIRFKFS